MKQNTEKQDSRMKPSSVQIIEQVTVMYIFYMPYTVISSRKSLDRILAILRSTLKFSRTWLRIPIAAQLMTSDISRAIESEITIGELASKRPIVSIDMFAIDKPSSVFSR